MDIRVKLLNYCKSKKINKADFCRITGVPTSFFNRESGVTSTTLESILSKFADLSAEWLLRDEGEMIRNLETNTNTSTQCDEKNALIDYLKEQLAKQTEMSQNLLKMFNEKN